MKTKKIVIGAMAAAMLSLSVCSIAPAVAADETVQISVSKTTAEAGGEFKVDVSLAGYPDYWSPSAATLQSSTILRFLQSKDITAGTLAGTVSGDASSSMLPNFNNYSQEGLISVMWSTSVDDASKWLKGEGTFCTITGTVAAGTANGTVSEITVLPTSRETYDGSGVMNDAFDCGYLKDGVKVNFNVKPNAGSVTIGSEETTTTPPATTTTTTENKPGVSLRGDANLDNKVSVADAVAILQSIANKDKYALKPQGAVNGDVEGNNDGITGADALRIQKWDAGAITTL
uniref:Scaffoldin C n=1 Tax=Ruminococcus flavefaciens TaxID=1265 RepID=G9FDB7_RUMFL|nr:scaffoldin C [Ruminococcus flavefaciens]